MDDVKVSIRDASGGALRDPGINCAGECLDIEVVAQGGNPPYSFIWDDGSTNAKRHVCPQTPLNLTVRVTDTPLTAAEFSHVAQTVTAALAIAVRGCSAAGTPQTAAADAGAVGDKPVMCQIKSVAPCVVAPGIRLPEDVTVDVPGAEQRHFAGGAALPAGRYRLEYVDGCNTFGVSCDWTVNGSNSQPGVFGCFLVANDNTVLGPTPGTTGVYVDPDPTIGGAFATYGECVAANCSQPPLDFDFAGGTLGVQRDGGGVLGAVDDAGGETVGGRSPTFRLSRLDCK